MGLSVNLFFLLQSTYSDKKPLKSLRGERAYPIIQLRGAVHLGGEPEART